MFADNSSDKKRKDKEENIEKPETETEELENEENYGEEEDDYVEDTAETVAVKQSPKKGRLILSAVLVVILAAIATSIYFSVMSSYGSRSELVFFSSEGRTYIAYKNGSKAEIDAKMHSNKLSLNGTKGAVMTDWDFSNLSGTLYYLSGKGEPELIAENVHEYAVSDTGKGVIFFTDYDDDYGTAVLSLYNGGTTYVIEEKARLNLGTDDTTAVISPDGNTLFYLKDTSAPNAPSYIACISVKGYDGKEIENSGNIKPVAIANNSNYVYYNKGNVFTVQNRRAGEETEISKNRVGNIFFNRDYSQAVFTESVASAEDGWRTYVSVKGGKSKKVYNSQILNFIIPQNAQTVTNPASTVYGFFSFKNKAFLSNYGVFAFDSELKSERITANYVDAQMSYNGKRLFYIEAQTLKSALVSDPTGKKSVIAEEVVYFVPAPGANVYYVNSNGELYRHNARKADNNGEGVWVADFVTGSTLTFSGTGRAFYLNSDGDLIAVSGTGKKRVKTGVAKVAAFNNNVFYYLDAGDGHYDIYRSSGGTGFSRLFQNIPLTDDTAFSNNDYNNDYNDDYYHDDDYLDDDWGDVEYDWDDGDDWDDDDYGWDE